MTRFGRILAIASYTWSGAWRRWMVFVPPALMVLVFLLQLPRVAHVASLFDRSEGGWHAIAAFADLVESIHASCIVAGIIFALALGVSSTGRFGVRQQLAPVLARPLWRFEFVLGRTIGLTMVLAVFSLLPVAALETLRYVVGSPVRPHPLAYLIPFVIHLLVLSGGMATGSFCRAIPAAFVALVYFWGSLFAEDRDGVPGILGHQLSEVFRWVAPPLGGLFRAAVPFHTPSTVLDDVALLVQATAWIGIFCAITIWRYQRDEFGTRTW